MSKKIQQPIEKRFLSQRMRNVLTAIAHKCRIATLMLDFHKYPWSEGSSRNININDNNLITFCPKDKPTLLSDNGKAWLKKGRVEIKIGKFLRLISAEAGWDFNDASIEVAVNLITSINKTMTGNKDDRFKMFQIVEGENIRRWYMEENYHESTRGSTLGKSCMRYHKCLPYFDIYVDNPHVCKMLIMLDDKNEKLLGRAILWKTNFGMLMERVYGNDRDVELFCMWARENGYIRLAKQDYGTKTFIMPDGTEFISGHICVNDITVRDADRDMRDDGTPYKYPYLDTFRYVYKDAKRLCVEFVGMQGGYIGHATDGQDGRVVRSTGMESLMWSEIYNEWLADTDGRLVNYTITEDGGNVKAVYGFYKHEDLASVKGYGSFVLKEHAVRPFGGTGRYPIFSNSIVKTESGDWCIRDKAVQCSFDKKYYLPSDTFEMINISGGRYCVHIKNVSAFYESRGFIMQDGAWVRDKTIRVVPEPTMPRILRLYDHRAEVRSKADSSWDVLGEFDFGSPSRVRRAGARPTEANGAVEGVDF